jgi:Na+-translocating ferredoxin:NAD+ oxidoreductase subunit D
MQLFTVSGSPHVHNNQSVEKIMWGVVIAMIPALLVSLWYFGLAALITTAIAVLSCVILEYAIAKYVLKEQPSITDGSAVVTGILLAFNVPSSIPWWQLVIGSMVAIGVAKMSFGGLGRNPFNPALVGRVFMLISFPVDMTLWPLPIQNRFILTDAITGPTSLGIVKEGVKNGETLTQLASQVPDYTSMFMGGIGGSLGEVSAAALIIGGIYMLYKKIITWHIPVSYLLTVFIFTGLLWLINPEQYIDPVFHLLAGGLMLGAIYMATDMATSPMTSKGMLVYGLGCGVLTVLIRVWGAYPEGVSFAILIMNAVTPLINKGFKPARFGEVVKA